MSKITDQIQMEVSGSKLADWWWECDSYEQAEFFERLEEIKHTDPAKFAMQLLYIQEALQRLFADQLAIEQ